MDFYLIPELYKYINTFAENKLYFAFEVKSRYWHVEIDEAQKDKTDFSFHLELERSFHSTLWLRSSPEIIQRSTDVILSTAKFKLTIGSTEVIVVPSKVLRSHIGLVHYVCSFLHRESVTQMVEKFQFSTRTMDHLVYAIPFRRL